MKDMKISDCPLAMASSSRDGRSQIYFKRGPCRIVLKWGDLRNEETDVIVVPSPHRDDSRENFLIFKSVYAAADNNFKQRIDDCLQKLQRGKGHFISSYGRHYILSAPPYLKNDGAARKILGQLYTSCIALANDQHLQTISFPTIGCGQIGFKVADVAEIIYEALEHFDPRTHKSIQEIRIVIYKPDDYDVCVNTFLRLTEAEKAKIKFDQM